MIVGGAAGAGPAGLNAAAAVACCQLEGALYAANVILGRLGDTSTPEVDQLVQQLVVYAAAAASAHAGRWLHFMGHVEPTTLATKCFLLLAAADRHDRGRSCIPLVKPAAVPLAARCKPICATPCAHLPRCLTELIFYGCVLVLPADIHKLAGTALTLLGGLSTWLVGNPSHLPDVMNAAIIALRSSDDKLARNAATCVQRLTSCEQLAALLFASQPACVQQLLTEYQRRGGLPMTLGEACV